MKYLIVFIFFLACLQPSHAATVKTKRGIVEGNVIARTFDEIVVTVFSTDKRLYQFAAKDVESITSATDTLIGKNTILYGQASKEGHEIIPLTHGLEVTILDDSPDHRWVKVKAWSSQEGWIERDVLTDRVVFTAEEKRPAPQERNEASETVNDATNGSPSTSGQEDSSDSSP